LQALLAQSVLAWQLWLKAQRAQLLAPPQSMSVSVPSLRWSVHVLDAQSPDTLSQAVLVQSVLARHFFPTPQVGQVPPPQSVSVSAPSCFWSIHRLLTQVELTRSQMLLAQAGLLVQNPPFGTPTQAPLLQLCPLVHAWPHAPQLLVSVFVLTSQPSAGLPLQSWKPALQVWTAQAPSWQAGVPLGTEQTAPHPPQLLASVFVLTSQPSALL
jgi:hypothetical protein